jgi:hypothetical protein
MGKGKKGKRVSIRDLFQKRYFPGCKRHLLPIRRFPVHALAGSEFSGLGSEDTPSRGVETQSGNLLK